MEKNKPLELALDLLKHSNIVRNNEYRFVTPDFGIVISFTHMESRLFRLGQPYRLKEGRIIRGLRGKARITINLIEYNIYPQTIATFLPGSIIELLEFTPDYDFQMIAADKDFLPLLRGDQLFESHTRQNLVTQVTDTEWKLSDAYFTLIWDTVQEVPFRREVVQHLLAALLHNIKYIRTEEANDTSHRFSHQEEIFWRFIALVNEFSKKRTHRGLLCRQVMPDPTLPEHPDPAGQSPDSNGMDQPVRHSRSKSVIETQQSACLPNLGRTSFSESLFLLQVL